MAFSFIILISSSYTLTKREAAILKICPPAIITSAEVIIAEYDAILGQWEREHFYNHLSNYTKAWYKHERGWENSRQLCKSETKSRGSHIKLSRILPTPLVFISGYANTGKKFSNAFKKYFSKLIRQMKGVLFINFLIQKDFLNTRSRQSSFLITNQNAHLMTYEPMKFRVTKSNQSSNHQRASECLVNESDISFESF